MEPPPLPPCHQLLTVYLLAARVCILCLTSGKDKPFLAVAEHRHLRSYRLSGTRERAKLEGEERPRRHRGQDWCGCGWRVSSQPIPHLLQQPDPLQPPGLSPTGSPLMTSSLVLAPPVHAQPTPTVFPPPRLCASAPLSGRFPSAKPLYP